MTTASTVQALVARAVEVGGLPVDDVLAVALPLLEQVASLHEVGRVAPLRGLGAVRLVEHRLEVDASRALSPTRNRKAVAAAEDDLESMALEVSRGAAVTRDLTRGVTTDRQIDVDPESPPSARIVAGWQRWEHLVHHHDELTDIGSLGELLAALLCGVDLGVAEQAAELAHHRRNLFGLAPRLHPVVAGIVTAMVEPDRRRREQDLRQVVTRLRTYRDQPEDLDLERVVTAPASAADRRAVVLTHLRDRLFDLSRRNPLLHFRGSARTLNLTQASVPLVLDVRSIRPEQLFTWGGDTARRLAAGKVVDVGSVVRWEDAPYAESSLDTIGATARRDRAEYGQDQLRLVVAFLRWHNVHDDPGAVITSPLVLAGATITKKRGVRRSYRLELTEPGAAEVNPVLRHQLRELYGFTLPETLDLGDAGAIDALRADIERQGRATERGLAVTLVEKPRIELIRARAETALQSYRRRRAGSRPMVGRRHYSYSYARPGRQPLGIQIFEDRLVREPLPIAVELGDAPSAAARGRMVETRADGVIEQDVYSVREGSTNPFSWEVDLCSVTLANFSYRTLSLVRDYDALLADPQPSASFEELFSAAPRDLPATPAPIPVEDRYLVVPADDSQLAAIAQARAEDNFVIQGPPGTGKSQTITNLIADYLARGRRVLFVCQKRAALDVVHARLRSRGLDEVCTLVHDSQADKKAFVHSLRDTYQAWLQSDVSLPEVEARREAIVAECAAVRDELVGLDTGLTATFPGSPRPIDLLDRLAALHASRWGDRLEPHEVAVLPPPASWAAARPAVDRLMEALARAGGPTTLASSPVALVDATALDAPGSDVAVSTAAARLGGSVARVRALLGAGTSDRLGLDGVRRLADLHALLDPLARHGRVDAVRLRSRTGTELTAAARQQAALTAAAADAAAAASGWRSAPSVDETREALDAARRKEGSGLRFLSGAWRRARAMVESSYDGTHGVAQALALLVAHQDAAAALADDRARAEAEWGHADLPDVVAGLEEAHRLDGDLAAWRDLLAGADDTPRESLDDLAAELATCLEPATGLVVPGQLPLARLSEQLAALAAVEGTHVVRAVAPSLRDLAAQPDVLAALRTLDANADRLDYAVHLHALHTARAAAPSLDRIDGRRIGDLVDRLATLQPDLQRVNAEVVVARLRARFVKRVEHSTRSVSGMSGPERVLKARWSTGRREVEHEFGKVRAYKSIRTLAEGDSGAVVAALRPVWLMSPSSLSDTLALTDAFDVVIYDEASQVPVEEAVPALHRAGQVIVVGDRMQLPPTRYFRTGPDASDADPTDDEGEQLGVVLDAASFLAVASTRLPSTMLLWHYRSRFEALIAFSNAAFYEGRLATVPDRDPATPERAGLHVESDGAAEQAEVSRVVDALLGRSISVVRVDDAVYDRRTNAGEAAWIAALVRELLLRRTGLTLGVVAFSEAQQGEIERALERLGDADPAFATAYEEELGREEDGQGVGLFVKNLENVQGDERDVILMSVCYAAGPDGRMRMNFGPINNGGGEKRLNVIFSRARRHMVLASSIEPGAITNTYNDGANTLRGFLQYAESVSRGDDDAAAAALGTWQRGPGALSGTPAIVTELAAALRDRGVDVRLALGRSGFRCDLALRPAAGGPWVTAVLVDHAARVDGGSTEQRRLVQPSVLSAAGWRVEQVVGQEWLDRPTAVLDRLVASLTTVGA